MNMMNERKRHRLLSLLLVLVFYFSTLVSNVSLDNVHATEDCSGNHTWSSWKVRYDPTCHEYGIKERYCKKCSTEEIAKIPKTKHKWSSWYLEYEPDCCSRGMETKHCNICYDEKHRYIPKTNHKWGKWRTIKKATVLKKGKKKRTCSYCDKVSKKSIPKKKGTKAERKSLYTVKKYLSAAKHYNVKKMDKCFAKKSKKYGFPTKKNIVGIYKKYNKKMKWKLLSISGGKKQKTVKAKVYCVDFENAIYNACYNSMVWGFKKWGYNLESHADKIADRIVKNFKKRVKKQKNKYRTKTATFKLAKKGSSWKIKKRNKSMCDLVLGNFWKGQEDAEDDFIWYALLHL